jgi:LmbE family N-acetylglucosaminyl deacetylase
VRLRPSVLRLAARVKPLVPAAAWPLLVTARSLSGDRPLVGAPVLGRLLVLAAHPDDETIGCGGLVALTAASGAEVRVLVATRGEATKGSPRSPEDVARSRTREVQAACRLLGAVAPTVLDLPDGALGVEVEALGRVIAEHVRVFEPDAIALPWFLDGHPDHVAVGQALELAAIDPATELWGYETWTPLPPNRLVDITGVIGVKEAAIAAHRTAHLAFDASAVLALNRYRAAYGGLVHGSAEAFLVAPAARWFAMAASSR